jgi:four helix bundle protein
VVYRKANQLAKEIFITTKSFPQEEMYALTDQIRRSSRAIGAQIAEAWAKRRYEKHFVSKLTDADAEQQETQHWIETALFCGYISPEKTKKLINQCTEIGRMLGSMISQADHFCKAPLNKLRENHGQYFLEPSSE